MSPWTPKESERFYAQRGEVQPQENGKPANPPKAGAFTVDDCAIKLRNSTGGMAQYTSATVVEFDAATGEGLWIGCRHGFEGVGTVEATDAKGKKYRCRFLGTARDADLSMGVVEGWTGAFTKIADTDVQRGDPVYSNGFRYARGLMPKWGNAVMSWSFSADSGDSGSGVFKMSGEFVAVVVAKNAGDGPGQAVCVELPLITGFFGRCRPRWQPGRPQYDDRQYRPPVSPYNQRPVPPANNGQTPPGADPGSGVKPNCPDHVSPLKPLLEKMRADIESLRGKVDGLDGQIQELRARPLAKDGKNGADGKPGRDGIDGKPGKDGTDADPKVWQAMIERLEAGEKRMGQIENATITIELLDEAGNVVSAKSVKIKDGGGKFRLQQSLEKRR